MAFLHADSLLAYSPECLNALVALNSATDQGTVPNLTALIFPATPWSPRCPDAIRDACRLDVAPASDLQEPLSRLGRGTPIIARPSRVRG